MMIGSPFTFIASLWAPRCSVFLVWFSTMSNHKLVIMTISIFIVYTNKKNRRKWAKKGESVKVTIVGSIRVHPFELGFHLLALKIYILWYVSAFYKAQMDRGETVCLCEFLALTKWTKCVWDNRCHPSYFFFCDSLFMFKHNMCITHDLNQMNVTKKKEEAETKSVNKWKYEKERNVMKKGGKEKRNNASVSSYLSRHNQHWGNVIFVSRFTFFARFTIGSAPFFCLTRSMIMRYMDGCRYDDDNDDRENEKTLWIFVACSPLKCKQMNKFK